MLSPKPDSFYHTEQKIALGYQNPFYLKQAQKKQQIMYDGKVLLEKHDPPVVHDFKETLQLAQETKFVGDFKSLAKEANDSLAKHKALELEIERLLRVVVVTPGMFRINPFKTSKEEKHVPNNVRATARTKPIIVSQHPIITKKDVNFDSNGLSSTGIDNTKTRRPQYRSNTKNDRVPSASKSSRSKNKGAKVEEHHRNLPLSKNTKHMSSAYNNIKFDSQNVISKVVCAMCKQCLISVNHDDTSKNTKFAKQPIMENLPKIGEINALSKPVTSNSVSSPQESKGVNNDNVITPGMFMINPSKTSREEKHVPNTVSASNRTKPITVSQSSVITKKDVNSDLNGLSSIGVDNTKTRRPQPRSNTKHDRVPSASKSSRSKNKEAEVEQHHRNLLLSKITNIYHRHVITFRLILRM
uniref:Gag-Pol polyprotein n=1 Tax=Tanacetum cinerariifolium TaxID=118510 RepID=A0A699KFC0_TANCI|nr:Gag-Pol polyprotein [Tanacetum cinerariifolium]